MSERPTATHRVQRARALAALFGAGGFLSLVVMLLPGWAGSTAGVLVTSVLALLCAAGLALWAPRVRRWAITVLLTGGTALIAGAQYLTGSANPSNGFATFYVWIALFAAAYLTTREVVVQLLISTIAHCAVLIELGAAVAAPRVILILGTQVAAAAVVGRLARHLRCLAETDPLTGTVNRRGVEKALSLALARGRRRPDEPICVAALDLNDFKDVNDESGHAAGDRVLVELTAEWRGRLRETDTLARTGGDEFLVVMPDCGLPQAHAVVERLLAAPARVSVSAGLARWDGNEGAPALIARADSALYRAKESGPIVVAVPGD